MKKEILNLLLASTLVLNLVGCGGSSDDVTLDSTSTEGASAPQSTETAPTIDEYSTISERVVYEENDLKVTVLELEQDNLIGPRVTMLFENNSTENFIFQVGSCTINEYMIEPVMSVDVAAGKKATDGMIFTHADLDRSGIGKFTDISFVLKILTQDFWTKTQSELISLETSNTGKYTQEHDATGLVIYENNGLKVVAKELLLDGIFGPSIRLYIENNSGQDVMLQTDNFSVDGFMVTSLFSCTVLNGARAVSDIVMHKTDLDQNGIQIPLTSEFSLKILNPESLTEILKSDIIAINFSEM